MKNLVIIALASILIGGCSKSNNELAYVPYTYNGSLKEITGANTKNSLKRLRLPRQVGR
jgi:hypothetical protein